MLVVVAAHRGMCFGVKDALEIMRELPNPEEVTVYGELVHNPVVTDEMDRRGFLQQSETGRHQRPQTPDVLITAHGVSDKAREEFEAAGYNVHDTTCPLVRRAHKAALFYHRRDYFILLIGKAGHVEVEGLAGDLDHHLIISSLDEVKSYPVDKIAVVNQTTIRTDDLALYHQRIKEMNPNKEIKFVDTTCQPTRDRQQALEDLLGRVDALVVVGGPNSNNTRQLAVRARQRGVRCWHIATASEIEPDWFTGIRIVGLTAGTSTTEETIREVARTLRAIKPAPITASPVASRSMRALSYLAPRPVSVAT